MRRWVYSCSGDGWL